MTIEHKARRLQKKLRDEEERERNEGLQAILANPIARRWLWYLLADCGTFRNPFNSDPVQLAFQSGEQNVGQRVLAQITELNPEAYLEMMKENNDAQRRARQQADELRERDRLDNE